MKVTTTNRTLLNGRMLCEFSDDLLVNMITERRNEADRLAELSKAAGTSKKLDAQVKDLKAQMKALAKLIDTRSVDDGGEAAESE